MTVGSTGAAVSGDVLVSRDCLSRVGHSKLLANWLRNAVVRLVERAVDGGLEGSAISSAWHTGSNVDLLIGSVDSNVAVERVDWGAWRRDSWVEAGVATTAASGQSWLEGRAVVVHSQLVAGADWIASVDSGIGHDSVQRGRNSGRGAFSLTSLPSSDRVWLVVDEEPGVATNWVIVDVGDVCAGVNLSGQFSQVNVAVVVVVAAASGDGTIGLKSLALVV